MLNLKITFKTIQASLYIKFPWISICVSSRKIVSHVGYSANNKKIASSIHCMLLLGKDVFFNRKTALQKFAGYEKSELKHEATLL